MMPWSVMSNNRISLLCSLTRTGCFMPKGHKDLFEVNSRDDRAGFWFLHNLKVNLPHLIDEAVLQRSSAVIASSKLFQDLKNDKISTGSVIR
jgi:hypothetical protein